MIRVQTNEAQALYKLEYGITDGEKIIIRQNWTTASAEETCIIKGKVS